MAAAAVGLQDGPHAGATQVCCAERCPRNAYGFTLSKVSTPKRTQARSKSFVIVVFCDKFARGVVRARLCAQLCREGEPAEKPKSRDPNTHTIYIIENCIDIALKT